MRLRIYVKDKKNGDMENYHITIENYKKEIDSI